MVLAFMAYYNDPKMGGIRGYFGDFLIKDFVRVGVLEYRSTGLLSKQILSNTWHQGLIGIFALILYRQSIKKCFYLSYIQYTALKK